MGILSLTQKNPWQSQKGFLEKRKKKIDKKRDYLNNRTKLC